jgi:EF-hand domain pair
MRKLSGVALAASVLLLSSGGSFADPPEVKATAKHGNPEAVFKRIDTNKDGKLSKEEFKAFIDKASNGKFADRPELIDRLFARLDTNGDGFLSLSEFKKLPELRAKLAEKKKAQKEAETANQK